MLTAGLLFSALNTRAQGNLQRQISLSGVRQQQIGQLLDNIARESDFSFAYNNRSIPADSTVSLASYRGSVNSLLQTILGAAYEFKEVPGYIILRHAPEKMELQAEVDHVSKGSAVISGQIRDAATGLPVAQASVYEKSLLTSTLTDRSGHFELRIRKPHTSLILAASREGFRDTSLNLLLPVVVSVATPPRRYRYYPGQENELQDSRLKRLFTSSRQRIQNLNLGQFFTYSPYQVSLVPGLSTHGMYNSQVINTFSLNALGGYTAGVRGVELAGLFNINQADMEGFQSSGVFNMAGGDVNGLQIAGVFNIAAGTIRGVQASAVMNRVRQLGMGAQLTGFANIAGNSDGLQLAAFGNYATGKAKVQLAGFGNRTGGNAGAQVAGFINSAGGTAGFQLAPVLNVAKKVSGLQFAGFMNVADSSDYPIGLVNLIKNGSKGLSLGIDEAAFLHLGFRSGGRVLYGLVALGYRPDHVARYGLEVGFGGHLLRPGLFSMDAEITNRVFTDFRYSHFNLLAVKALPGISLGHGLRLFTGPSLSYGSIPIKNDADLPGWRLYNKAVGENLRVLSAGWNVGLQFGW